MFPLGAAVVTSDVRAIAREVLVPLAHAGEPGRVNRPLVRALGEHGLLEPVLPLEGKTSAVGLCMIREALATESPEAETAFALQGLGTHPILSTGSPRSSQRWVPASGRGRGGLSVCADRTGGRLGRLGDQPRGRARRETVGASPASRSGSRTHRRQTSTRCSRARRREPAREGDSLRRPGRLARPRRTSTRPHLATPHRHARLDGVAVPGEAVLGEVDEGFRVAMRTLNVFRPSVGAGAIGMAQAALEAAISHTAERRAFGKSLGEFQAVSQPLAEMATRIEAARQLVRAAATAYDSGAADVPSCPRWRSCSRPRRRSR